MGEIFRRERVEPPVCARSRDEIAHVVCASCRRNSTHAPRATASSVETLDRRRSVLRGSIGCAGIPASAPAAALLGVRRTRTPATRRRCGVCRGMPKDVGEGGRPWSHIWQAGLVEVCVGRTLRARASASCTVAAQQPTRKLRRSRCFCDIPHHASATSSSTTSTGRGGFGAASGSAREGSAPRP